MRLLTLLSLTALLLSAGGAQAAGVSATDTADGVCLRNERLALTLDKGAKGAIRSLRDVATDTEFIASAPSPALFSLAFSVAGQPTAPLTRLSSADAAGFTVACPPAGKGQAVVLTYEDVRQTGVNVVCRATVAPGDPLVRWRLSATFPATMVLEEVTFPICALRVPLGNAPADDAVVIGATKGGVLRNPAAFRPGEGFSATQPGNLAAQFGCYYGPRAGFYSAAYDETGYPKRVSFSRTPDGLQSSWTQNCFAASPFHLDYDVVMSTFTGSGGAATDWRDAADLYRSWVQTQPWCKRTLAQRTDLPAWLLAGPAMVRFGRNWLAEPDSIRQWLAAYWTRSFPRGPLITAYWGWEKIETWVTPDYFPVFPSDEAAKALIADSRRQDCHGFFWPSGYHWTLTFDKQPDGSFRWDDRQRFDSIASAHAIRTRDGKVYAGDRSWLRGGATSCLCPGDPWTINWWNEQVAAPIASRGVEIIQSDQVVGGGFPYCYSTTHGHPPGPGPWMAQAFAEQLRSEAVACRKLQRDLVVCFEEPNERFNQLVGLQDYRDCESPYEWASVFNYVYHDFLPTFQSNPRAGDTFMTAYCFANGEMPHMVPSRNLGPGPLLDNGGFERGPAEGQLPGWGQVKEYAGKVWTGTWTSDEQEKHGGAVSMRLDNATDADTVQVSQNVAVGGEFAVGRTYRLSAWLKTDHAATGGAVGVALLTDALKSLGGTNLPYPAPGAGWTKVSGDFTIAPGADFLRIMIHVQGKARLWIDDMTLEEVLPDGKVRTVPRPEVPPDHALMRRWVELYHGAGRPYLLLGRMLHPPQLTAATIDYRGRQVPAILHNAFRAPDGSEACVLVNAARSPQTGSVLWKERSVPVKLDAGEAELLR